MKKTSIYLDEDLDRALDVVSAQVGVTKAEVIRRALRAAVSGFHRPGITAIGVGEGPGGVADDVDRHLRETGFGEA